jgi:hypothetical protein
MAKTKSITSRAIKALLNTAVGKQIKAELAVAVAENDNTFYPGGLSANYRDRYDYDRTKVLAECLRAWRVQPLARRIVKLYTQFVIGEGFTSKSDHKATQNFLVAWWKDPLNDFDNQVTDWMDELTRSGNLFFLFSIDPLTCMSYIRAIPADQIKDIQSAENDIRQETFYIPVDLNASPWPAYDPRSPDQQDNFIVHYAVNRPVGVVWGEPDLAPLLPWIGRYSAWLEDRARLNRFRFAWLIVWKRKWETEAQKKAKQNELNANPPTPGSFLLLDENETVEMPAPNLNSTDAEKDGLALKKMISAGAGIPLHYLAEPESATRTTAEAAGTPTFRGLEQSQTSFLRALSKLATIAARIRKQSDRRVNPDSKIAITGPDITERDNSILALAVSRIYPVLSDLFDRSGIDEDELLRLVYRMAGEAYDQNIHAPGMLKRPLKPVEPLSPTPITPEEEQEEGATNE